MFALSASVMAGAYKGDDIELNGFNVINNTDKEMSVYYVGHNGDYVDGTDKDLIAKVFITLYTDEPIVYKRKTISPTNGEVSIIATPVAIKQVPVAPKQPEKPAPVETTTEPVTEATTVPTTVPATQPETTVVTTVAPTTKAPKKESVQAPSTTTRFVERTTRPTTTRKVVETPEFKLPVVKIKEVPVVAAPAPTTKLASPTTTENVEPSVVTLAPQRVECAPIEVENPCTGSASVGIAAFAAFSLAAAAAYVSLCGKKR